MRIKKIRMRGVTRFIDEFALDLTVVPPNALVAVVGENGAGKTTFMEAVPAALYRELPSRGGGLKQWCTGRDAFLEVELDYLGSAWRHLIQVDTDFNGGRGKEEGFLFQDGAPLTGGRVTDYDEAIEARFPSRALFLASAFAAQNRAGNFLELDIAARKALFTSLLGNNDLQVLAERAAGHRRPLDAIAEKLDAEALAFTEQRTRLAALRDELAALRAGLAQHAEAARVADAGLAQATANKAAAFAVTEAAEKDRSAALARQTALATEIGDLEWSLQRKQAEARTLRSVISTEEAIRARAAELAEASRVKASLGEMWLSRTADVRARAAAVAACRVRLDAAVADVEAASGRWERARAARDRLPIVEARVRDLAAARADRDAAKAALTERTAAHVAARAAFEADRANTGAAFDRATAALTAAREAAGLVADVPCRGKRVIVFGCEADEELGDGDRVDCGTCRFLVNATAAAAKLPELEQAVEAAEAAGLVVASRYAALREEGAALDLDARALEGAEADVRKLAPFEVEHAAVKAQVDAATAVGEALSRASAARDRETAELATLVGQHEAAQQDLAATEADGATAAERVTALAGADAALRELERAIGSLPGVEEAIAAARTRHAAATEERAGITVPPQPVEAQARLAAAREAEATARTAAEAARAALGRAREDAARVDGRINELGDVEGGTARVEERRRRVALRRSGFVLLERALGRDGIQALEIDAAGPEVSRLCNELLEGCYGPRFQISLLTIQEAIRGRVQKEIFDIAVHDGLRGGVRPHGALSGGEKVLVDEGLKLALAIFNAQRHGGSFETLWRDECDGALSTENAARYPGMLRAAMRLGGFSNIYFVTHRPEVAAQADAVVRLDGGRAWVELQ